MPRRILILLFLFILPALACNAPVGQPLIPVTPSQDAGLLLSPPGSVPQSTAGQVEGSLPLPVGEGRGEGLVATEVATTKPPPIPLPPTPLILPPPADPLITHGARDLPYVALTFDLCEKPEYPAGFDTGIFAELTAADAPATFFMGGHWAMTHPAEARSLASIPYFEIGNHSWTHPDLPGLSQQEVSDQVTLAQDKIFEITGRTPTLFRLPAGLYEDWMLPFIGDLGLKTIQWEVVTGDPDPNVQAADILRAVRSEAQNGSIIIMHANGRGWHTAEALPEVIAWLRAQGYTLVTVSQLIGLAPIE